MNDRQKRIIKKLGLSEDEFKPKDRIGDVEDALVEVADMVAENEINIEDITEALCELAEMIGG